MSHIFCFLYFFTSLSQSMRAEDTKRKLRVEMWKIPNNCSVNRGSCWWTEMGLLRCCWRLRHQKRLRLIFRRYLQPLVELNTKGLLRSLKTVHLKLDMCRLGV